MYHVVMQKEDRKHVQEASAIRLLRKKQIAKTIEKQQGKKPGAVKDEMPSSDERFISKVLLLLQRELAPVIERIEQLEQDVKNMKEDN